MSENGKRTLAHVAGRFVGTPLLLHPPKLDVIIRALGPRIGIEGAADAIPTDIQAGAYSESASGAEFEIVDGIAVIPVEGTLIKKETWMSAWSGCTSYAEIQRQMAAAVNDGRVQGILLDIDSPGGEVSGCFELADYIYSLRGSKPIYAVANDAALSAAYAIASCADKIFVTRSGCVGSVGVYALHVDESGWDQQAGMKYNYVHAGAKKVDGNPHAPLSESAETDMQAEVDREYKIFTSLVARNRKVDEKKIVGTEAGLLWADNAIPLLADAVGTIEDAMSALLAKTGRVSTAAAAANPQQGVSLMAETQAISAAAEEMEKPCGKTEAEPDPDDPDKKEEEDEMELKDKKAEAVKAASEPVVPTIEGRSNEDIAAIGALCNLAGCPGMATKYLSEKKSIAEVSEILTKARVEESEKHVIESHVNPNKGATARIQDIEAEATAYARQNVMQTTPAAYVVGAVTRVTKERAFAQMLEANPEAYAAFRGQHNAKALMATLEAAGVQFPR